MKHMQEVPYIDLGTIHREIENELDNGLLEEVQIQDLKHNLRNTVVQKHV